jgi:phosphoribosylanthranilate isomerase
LGLSFGIQRHVSHRVVRVKVCGLTHAGDAAECAHSGVDWIGLNFHPGSTRYVQLPAAAKIIAALPQHVQAVGVFVDRPPSEVAGVARLLGLQIVQLHGHEPPEDLLALDHLCVIRAFGLGSRLGWEGVVDYLDRARTIGRLPDAVLLDAAVAGRTGGTGATITDEILGDCPPLPVSRLILAGGLNPANVAERVARIRPWMVDVASGVEFAPGRKSADRVAAFIAAARSVVLAEHG